MAYKKSKRTLPKYKETSKAAAKNRLKCGLGTTGHGSVNVRKLSLSQKNDLSERGYFNIQMNGVTRRVTRCNVTKSTGGFYYAFYMRSDTKKNALRNFCSDQSRAARHRAPTHKRVAGDTNPSLSNKPLPKARKKRKTKKKTKKR